MSALKNILNSAILDARLSPTELDQMLQNGTTSSGTATPELQKLLKAYRDLLEPEAHELLREQAQVLGITVDPPGELMNDASVKAIFTGQKLVSQTHNSKDPAVLLIQRALMRIAMMEGRPDLTLPKFGVDGDFGAETTAAVKAFQASYGIKADGIVGKDTIAGLDLCLKGRATELKHERFRDVQVLQDILDGKVKALGRGATGTPVKRVQQVLVDLGYPLPKSGVDGSLGSETIYALKQFQYDQGLPQSGRVDTATLHMLEAVAPALGTRAVLSPDYSRMVKNGVLPVVLGVGYDEDGWDLTERVKVLDGLKQRGFKKLDVATMTDAELRRKGVDPSQVDKLGTYYVKSTTFQGQQVAVLVKYVDRHTAGAKDRYVTGLQQSALVLYGGHARYGSGPDFDAKDSVAGNVVIGVNSTGHKNGTLTPAYDAHMRQILAGAPNDLETMQLPNEYQMMFFSGCTTKHYVDELRALPKGKSPENLDTITSNDVLYWDDMAANMFIVLDGVLANQTKNDLEEALFQQNNVSFTADGFGGNKG
jgi:peptidoglycan hydrolase-like protein with peptidoglycan-binding domain